jgi:hypothetical protein
MRIWLETAMRRCLQLIDEHIIDTPYTLPANWRISQGFEWGAHRTCYICFHLYVDLETDAYLSEADAVSACWELDRTTKARRL